MVDQEIHCLYSQEQSCCPAARNAAFTQPPPVKAKLHLSWDGPQPTTDEGRSIKVQLCQLIGTYILAVDQGFLRLFSQFNLSHYPTLLPSHSFHRYWPLTNTLYSRLVSISKSTEPNLWHRVQTLATGVEHYSPRKQAHYTWSFIPPHSMQLLHRKFMRFIKQHGFTKPLWMLIWIFIVQNSYKVMSTYPRYTDCG